MLEWTEYEIVKRIDKRLELTSNLETETSISLAMTEPEIGSQIVFMSNLKISLPCIMNAVLFWYNLMRSGEIDKLSRHAAYLVLTGINWITNKWFHERGQESRRPCGLNEFDQERYVGDLGTPEPKYHLIIRSKTKKMNRKH